jgi:hypothetical protein
MGYFLAEICVSLLAWRLGKLLLPQREQASLKRDDTASRKRHALFLAGAGAGDDHVRRSSLGAELQPGLLLSDSRLPENRNNSEGAAGLPVTAGGYAGGSKASAMSFAKKGLKRCGSRLDQAFFDDLVVKSIAERGFPRGGPVCDRLWEPEEPALGTRRERAWQMIWLLVLLLFVNAVLLIGACMRSSQLSRMEEERNGS